LLGLEYLGEFCGRRKVAKNSPKPLKSFNVGLKKLPPAMQPALGERGFT
jgi:hypothetical protein